MAMHGAAGGGSIERCCRLGRLQIGLLALSILSILSAACNGSGSGVADTTVTAGPTDVAPTAVVSTNVTAAPNRFDSHTVGRIDSLADFEALAVEGVDGHQVVKFTVGDFLGAPTVEFLDGLFYKVHDEWFWYHLLNGVPASGSDATPVEGLRFDSIDEIYEWATAGSTRRNITTPPLRTP